MEITERTCVSMARPFRLLIVDNFLLRHYGKGREGAGYRFLYGAVRNNWRVMTFSERDIARYLAPLGFMRGIGARMMNTRLRRTAANFRPDLIMIGHCDYVTNETIENIRRDVDGVKIVHINVDPIWQPHTKDQIVARMQSCDGIFVTTAGEELKQWTTGKNFVSFLPNPCDICVDNGESAIEPEYDIFFAGHGADGDPRVELLKKFLPLLPPDIKAGVFGTLGRPSIVGRDYEETLKRCACALNLNRMEGRKWYSSDRLVHIMANGVVAFMSPESGYQDFFADGKEAMFFNDANDLAEKVIALAKDPDRRLAIARRGMEKYRMLFNASRVLRFIKELSLGEAFSEPYEWQSEIYR